MFSYFQEQSSSLSYRRYLTRALKFERAFGQRETSRRRDRCLCRIEVNGRIRQRLDFHTLGPDIAPLDPSQPQKSRHRPKLAIQKAGLVYLVARARLQRKNASVASLCLGTRTLSRSRISNLLYTQTWESKKLTRQKETPSNSGRTYFWSLKETQILSLDQAYGLRKAIIQIKIPKRSSRQISCTYEAFHFLHIRQ